MNYILQRLKEPSTRLAIAGTSSTCRSWLSWPIQPLSSSRRLLLPVMGVVTGPGK